MEVKDNPIILLAIKAISHNSNIKSGYALNQVFSYWKIPINFVKLLERLIDAKLVKKIPNDDNTYMLVLTEKGKQLANDLTAKEILEMEMPKGFSYKNVVTFFCEVF